MKEQADPTIICDHTGDTLHPGGPRVVVHIEFYPGPGEPAQPKWGLDFASFDALKKALPAISRDLEGQAKEASAQRAADEQARLEEQRREHELTYGSETPDGK